MGLFTRVRDTGISGMRKLMVARPMRRCLIAGGEVRDAEAPVSCVPTVRFVIEVAA